MIHVRKWRCNRHVEFTYATVSSALFGFANHITITWQTPTSAVRPARRAGSAISPIEANMFAGAPGEYAMRIASQAR